MKAQIIVHDAEVMAGLKASRKEINQGIKQGLKQGAERYGLPTAIALAPGRRIRSGLHAGATTRSAFLEVKTRDAPQAGILEFGGTRRDVLLPKSKQALSTPYGPRVSVRGPRKYKAQRYLKRAVEASLMEVTQEAQRVIGEVFSRYVEVQ